MTTNSNDDIEPLLSPIKHQSTPSSQRLLPHDDGFVASMTFASIRRRRDCDCDDCDGGFGASLPQPLLSGLIMKKRQKMELTITRFQERILIKRQGPWSVWKLTLPRAAEPLVEFGNTHRIIYISRKPESSNLLSIGTGIIGSSDETTSRAMLPWTQGQAYLVPANGGKAVGWVHHDSDSGAQGPVELYWIKCPVLRGQENDEVQLDGWRRDVWDVVQHMGHTTNTSLELTEADTNVIKTMIRGFTVQLKCK